MFSFRCTMWVHIKQPKARAPYSLFSSYAAFFTTRSAKINSGSGLFVGAFFGSGGRCFPVHFCGGGMLLLVRCCGRAFLIPALGGGVGSRYEKKHIEIFSPSFQEKVEKYCPLCTQVNLDWAYPITPEPRT